MSHVLEKLRLRLPAIILLAATLSFWGLYDRHEPVAPPLLQMPGMADATRGRGDCTETNGVFTLAVPVGGVPASLNFRMPGANRFPLIRVRARIRTDRVEQGRYEWSCARILLLQYDAGDKWIPGIHGVVAKKGTAGWKTCEDVFTIAPGTVHVDCSLQQGGSSGTAWFDSIQVEPVRLRPSFAWWRGLFALLWIGTGFLFFRRCRLHRRRLRLLILLNALAILAGTLMPGKWIQEASEGIKAEAARQVAEQARRRAPPPSASTAPPGPAKPVLTDADTARIDQFNHAVGSAHEAGHFVLFATLCFLVYCSAALERQHPSYFAKVAFDLLLFAAITESLQLLTLDRTAGVRDWLTDLHGMLLAFGAFIALLLGRGLFLRLRRVSVAR